jgi:hypothetical protein
MCCFLYFLIKAGENCLGITYIQSFMKSGTGVKAILRFCLRNLRGCNVGITDEKDL